MAPINIKLDLIGSTLQKGHTDFRFTRATRRGRADGLLNNLNALDVAINEAAAQAGSSHQSIPTLPLASVSAVKFGPSKALLKLNYQYSRFRVPRPNTPARDLVRTRAVNVPTRVYRAIKEGNVVKPLLNGLPNGLLLGISPEDKTNGDATPPAGRMWRRPTIKIYLPTVINTNPLLEVVDLLGTVNDLPESMGGFTFGISVLRFDAVDVDWNFDPTGPGLFFDVVYHFTAVSGGHYTQHLLKPLQIHPDTNVPVTEWTTYNELDADLATWTGRFPVHA